MDLSLTAAQTATARSARDAFTQGTAAPILEGPITDLVIVARELGRAARPSTFHTDVLARLLGWQGPGLAAVGVAPACTGNVRLGPQGCDGVLGFVAHAAMARVVIVRTGPGEIAEVSVQGSGVTIRPQATIGDDDRGEVTLDAAPALTTRTCDVTGALARAAIVLAGDAVGAADAALTAAVAHVRRREQFGAPLATLQVVQHRCADMLIDVTLAWDAVLDGASVADRGEPESAVRRAASSAKATAVERCRRVTAAAHQLAGGQGIYADRPFHRWYRRVKAAEPVLGDARHHRAVVAAMLLDSTSESEHAGSSS